MSLNIKKNWKYLIHSLNDLYKFKTYKKAIKELFELGKLDELGIKIDPNLDMYIGINLNPELLFYSDISQEPAELRLISEKLGKYTDFFAKEGILDYIKLDYDRVKNDEFYGYILKISYNFKTYTRIKFIKTVAYLSSVLISLLSIIGISIYSLITFIY